jgi:hypothetical protein
MLAEREPRLRRIEPRRRHLDQLRSCAKSPDSDTGNPVRDDPRTRGERSGRVPDLDHETTR